MSPVACLAAGQISVKKNPPWKLQKKKIKSVLILPRRHWNVKNLWSLPSFIWNALLSYIFIYFKQNFCAWGEKMFTTTNLLRGSCYIAVKCGRMVHISNQNVWLTRRWKKQLVEEYSSIVCHVLFDYNTNWHQGDFCCWNHRGDLGHFIKLSLTLTAFDQLFVVISFWLNKMTNTYKTSCSNAASCEVRQILTFNW